MLNRKDKIVSAVGAALAAGAIGGGVAVANARADAGLAPAACTDVGGGPGTRGQRRMCWGSRHGQHSGGRQERSGGAGRLRASSTARTLRMLL
jgi:hypothetical protein